MGARVTRGAVAGGNNKIAEFPTIQLRVAEASASVDAAREIILRDIARAQQLAQAREDGTGEITEEDRILARRSQSLRSAWPFGRWKHSMHRQAASASRCPTPSSGHGAMQMPSGATFP